MGVDWSKEIEFSLEFVRRLIERGIIASFGNDLDRARKAIERKMRNESVVIDNPSERYPNQSWCVISIEGIGLAKIPVAETPRYVKAITIACPVTDPACKEAYRRRFMPKA